MRLRLAVRVPFFPPIPDSFLPLGSPHVRLLVVTGPDYGTQDTARGVTPFLL